MVPSKEKLSGETFGFLKLAMQLKPETFSARGPNFFREGDWEYSYRQEGMFENFNGYETIKYKGELVFEHRIVGGSIVFQS